MNKSAIEKFAKYARAHLMERVAQKASFYGITAKKIWEVESESTDGLVIHGTVHRNEIKTQREALVKQVRDSGFEQIVEEVAYTWFNRFCALRFMEVSDYLPTGVRVLSSSDPAKAEPDLLTRCLDVDLGLDKTKLLDLMDKHHDEELYKYLLIAQCNALNKPLPFLFETIEDYTELLFPDHMLTPDSLIRRLVNDIPEEDWREIEIVGWLYQFYISEKKDQVIGKVVKKEDIPSATQLFTPKWIVQYMVQNSLGRLWLEMHPDSPLRGKMDYYIENPDEAKGGLAQAERGTNGDVPVPCLRDPQSPETLTCMDDACGSGHILVVMFDILYAIYEEMGYVGRDIPSLILKHNLYGIDIDKRAVQLSSFSVMMKARAKDRRFLTRGVLPRVIEIQESNGIDLGFLLQIDKKALDAFRNKLKQQDMFEGRKDDDLFDYAVENTDTTTVPQWCRPLQTLVDLFHDAKNYGSLLTVDPALAEKLPEIHTMLDKVADDFFGPVAESLRELLVQAEVLSGQYDACVANPPYMGGGYLNPALKKWMKVSYKGFEKDLFSAFIKRNRLMTKSDGFLGFMTPFVWMFLSSYEALRSSLLKQSRILSLIRPEYHAFFDSAFVPFALS